MDARVIPRCHAAASGDEGGVVEGEPTLEWNASRVNSTPYDSLEKPPENLGLWPRRLGFQLLVKEAAKDTLLPLPSLMNISDAKYGFINYRCRRCEFYVALVRIWISKGNFWHSNEWAYKFLNLIKIYFFKRFGCSKRFE